MIRYWALGAFLALWVHGAALGASDDEAYYWVLSRSPDWGYAFHPPAVAWLIALSDALLGRLFGSGSTAVLRFPAAACAAGVLALCLDVCRRAGAPRISRAAAALLALAGVFGAAWMMVPDLPLLLGWALAFHGCWRVCFGAERVGGLVLAQIGAGCLLAILSKYSGVLVPVSLAIAAWLWAPRALRWRAIGAAALGAALAAGPILAWNASHDWASLAYQLSERQGGTLSPLRWGRYWAIQAVLAGPVLLAFALALPARLRGGAPLTRYVAVWAAPPAAVFCFQPLWADFKPHWSMVVWLPVAVELAWQWSRGPWLAGAIHAGVGLALGVILNLACHVALVSGVGGLVQGAPMDPKMDLSNDLVGWSRLPAHLEGLGLGRAVVVGSRYQTASQAAFALGDVSLATLLPRDLKQRDEWPDLGVSDGLGPAWPKLARPVVFVADYRYTAGPQFAGALCEPLPRLEVRRWGGALKWIDLWSCRPG